MSGTDELMRGLAFDPRRSTVIRRPSGDETGHGFWVGAPSVYYDAEQDLFYLAYRYHNHYEAADARCHTAYIAVSTDGVHFRDIKEFRKEQFGASALTRASVTKSCDGTYRYLMAHDNPEETKWTPGVIEARRIEELDASRWQPMFREGPAVGLSLRDPYAFAHAGERYVLLVMETILWPQTRDPADPYKGATCVRTTGLARYVEGSRLVWHGEIVPVSRDGWDSSARRVSCLYFDVGSAQFVGYYDGARVNSHEDRCGIVAGSQPEHVSSLSTWGPYLSAPWSYGSGALCSVDVVRARGRRFVYFETGMENGGHELRVSVDGE